MKVAFVVNDLQLSGGIGTVVQHARQLADRHSFDVSLALTRERLDPHWRFAALEGLHIATVAELAREEFDVAVATWWETIFSLFELRAVRYAYFVQSLEDRFYAPGNPDALFAGLTHELPLSVITEARWIGESLEALRPGLDWYYVRNGVDKAAFCPPDRPPLRRDEPLRIIIEGNPTYWFKGVEDSVLAVREMAEPRHVTLVTHESAPFSLEGVDEVVGPLTQPEFAARLANADVVLKTSRVEGMYGPPLEGFHMGATCVTTPVTGHEEYIRHGENALVTDWHDTRGAARQLDLLARDRRLLHELRCSALATAKSWPSWEQSGQFMAAALREIRRRPPETPPGSLAPLAANLSATLEATRAIHRRQVSEAIQLSFLRRMPGGRAALWLHARRDRRPVRALRRINAARWKLRAMRR